MQLAMSKTREKFPLSMRKPLKKTTPSIISSIVFFLVALVAGLFLISITHFGNNIIFPIVGIVGVILLVLCVLIYQYQTWYFQVYFYDLTDDFIIIRKRVFTPREITIPYERVQDVYVDQDLLDRVFGLYDVHLSSATISSGMEAHIDGVEKEAADGLRKVILEKVTEKIRKAKGTSS